MSRKLLAALCLLGLLAAGPVSAQMRALSDSELSTVSGQGLFSVSNSSYNGFDFTRIALDADVTLNANLANLRLGEYNYGPRNGSGADLDISALRFGRSDAGAAGVIATALDSGGGKRWDGTCTGCTLSLSQVGAVTAGDAAGPSRDFWISVLKTPVQFQAAPGMPALTEAQAGIWLNWRDKLSALNLTGTVPANTAPGH